MNDRQKVEKYLIQEIETKSKNQSLSSASASEIKLDFIKLTRIS